MNAYVATIEACRKVGEYDHASTLLRYACNMISLYIQSNFAVLVTPNQCSCVVLLESSTLETQPAYEMLLPLGRFFCVPFFFAAIDEDHRVEFRSPSGCLFRLCFLCGVLFCCGLKHMSSLLDGLTSGESAPCTSFFSAMDGSKGKGVCLCVLVCLFSYMARRTACQTTRIFSRALVIITLVVLFFH